MRHILIVLTILFLCLDAQAQAWEIKINRDQDPDSLYIMVSDTMPGKYRHGRGKWVSYEDFVNNLNTSGCAYMDCINNDVIIDAPDDVTLSADDYIDVTADRLRIEATSGSITLRTPNNNRFDLEDDKSTTFITNGYIEHTASTYVVDVAGEYCLFTAGTDTLYSSLRIDSTFHVNAANDIDLIANDRFSVTCSDNANIESTAGSVEIQAGTNINLFAFQNSTIGGGSTSINVATNGDIDLVTSGDTISLTGIVVINPSSTPASSSAAGRAGQIAWDATYVYICVATNTWHRIEFETW